MNILITGADGFVGRNLLYYVKYNVNTIVALVYKSTEYIEYIKLTNSKIIVIKYDANEEYNYLLLLKTYNIDIVIHLAAITNIKDHTRIYNDLINVNIISSIKLIQDSITYGVKKLIYISSAGIYLNQNKGHINNENDDISTKGMYLYSKSIVESMCKQMNGYCSTDFIILRVGTLFGEYEFKNKFRDKTSVIKDIIQILLQNQTVKISGLDVCRDFFHIDNLSNIVNKIINTKNFKYLIYNVGLNHIYSIRRILEYFGLLYDKRIWVETDQYEANIVLYSKDNRAALNTNRILELDNNYPNISLNEGLLKTHNWFKEYYHNK